MEQYRIHPSKGMEFGLYSLGDHIPNPITGERVSAQARITNDDVLFRMERLVEDTIVLTETYRSIREAKEAKYEF